jgi:hypothetical protein
MTGLSGPGQRHRVSLLATVALATLGVSCKGGNGTATDGAGGAGGGGAGGRDTMPGPEVGGAGGSGGGAGDAAGGVGGQDAGRRDTGTRDAAPMPPDVRDAGRFDAPVDTGPDSGPANPRQLWFAGPESDLHLSDIEPQVPF